MAPDLESSVTTVIRPSAIRPESSVGRALAQNAIGAGRDMLFFFAFLVGYILLFNV